MTHPNNMTTWDTIACQRGCERHYTREVEIEIGGPTKYADLTPIPDEYAMSFPMFVWDTDEHPVDGGPYCPAHDAVSETILSHGVWEPRESTVALWHFHNWPGVFVDMGAQVGWFATLATLSGKATLAYECDTQNAGVLKVNAEESLLRVFPDRITSEMDELAEGEICLAKLDLEGAEDQGIRILWPAIQAGMVAGILMEVSPVFDDYYPGLVNQIINQGYEAYMMPPKRRPPHAIDGSPESLARWRFDHLPSDRVADLVASWHQEDVLFARSE